MYDLFHSIYMMECTLFWEGMGYNIVIDSNNKYKTTAFFIFISIKMQTWESNRLVFLVNVSLYLQSGCVNK